MIREYFVRCRRHFLLEEAAAAESVVNGASGDVLLWWHFYLRSTSLSWIIFAFSREFAKLEVNKREDERSPIKTWATPLKAHLCERRVGAEHYYLSTASVRLLNVLWIILASAPHWHHWAGFSRRYTLNDVLALCLSLTSGVRGAIELCWIGNLRWIGNACTLRHLVSAMQPGKGDSYIAKKAPKSQVKRP